MGGIVSGVVLGRTKGDQPLLTSVTNIQDYLHWEFDFTVVIILIRIKINEALSMNWVVYLIREPLILKDIKGNTRSRS